MKKTSRGVLGLLGAVSLPCGAVVRFGASAVSSAAESTCRLVPTSTTRD